MRCYVVHCDNVTHAQEITLWIQISVALTTCRKVHCCPHGSVNSDGGERRASTIDTCDNRSVDSDVAVSRLCLQLAKGRTVTVVDSTAAIIVHIYSNRHVTWRRQRHDQVRCAGHHVIRWRCVPVNSNAHGSYVPCFPLEDNGVTTVHCDRDNFIAGIGHAGETSHTASSDATLEDRARLRCVGAIQPTLSHHNMGVQ